MWETLAAAKLIPDALIALEQGDDDAVKRLFKAAARPTAKLAEKAVRLQKAKDLLTEAAGAEEDPETGKYSLLLASEDAAAIEAAAQMDFLYKVKNVDLSEVSDQLTSMEEAADASDEAQKENIIATNVEVKGAIDSTLEALTGAAVPNFAVSTSIKPGYIAREVRTVLAPWTSLRPSLFATAAAVEPADGAAMLSSGSATLSRFDTHDPVLWVMHGLLSPPLVPTADSVSPPPLPSDEELAEAEAAVAELPPPPPPPEEGEEPVEEPEESKAAKAKLLAIKKARNSPEPEGIFCARLREKHTPFKRSHRDASLQTLWRMPPRPSRRPTLRRASRSLALMRRLSPLRQSCTKLRAVHRTLPSAMEGRRIPRDCNGGCLTDEQSTSSSSCARMPPIRRASVGS